VRLALSDDRLVGALVVGEQTLADPLRDLIDMQVNILPLRPYLEQGGAEMAQKVQQYWKLMKRCAANAPLTRVMM
jgi:NAD(P)H-nitrite reductase large subunit